MITVNGKEYDPSTFTPQIKAAIVQLDSCRQDKELLAVKFGVMAAAERALIGEIAAAVEALNIQQNEVAEIADN